MNSPEWLASTTKGFVRSVGVLMRLAVVAAMCLSMVGLAVAADARASIKMPTDIPAQGVGPALKTLAKDRGFQVVFRTEVVGNARTHGAVGDLTTPEALSQLLEGTSLAYSYLDENTVTILPRAELRAGAATESENAPKSGGVTQGGDNKEGQKRNSFRLAQLDQGTPAGTSAVSGSAQEASMGSTGLSEIIVTAQKKSERLQDVPVPLAVVDARKLEENNQVLLRDYAVTVPGLSISPNIEGSQMASIRGVTTGGFSNPTVGIMIDDVPYGFLNGNVVPDVDPGDLSRIEVLRGPQGTLYGADAMGGLIKYVTIAPSTEGVSGRVQVGANSVYNGAEPGFDFRASINLPLSDTLAVRASAFERQDAGYIDNPGLNRQGVNRVVADGARVSMLWTPSDTVSLRVSALYQYTKGYLSEVNTPGTWDQNYINGAARFTNGIQAYSAVLKAKLGTVDLTSVTGYTLDRTLGSFDYTPFFADFTRDGVPGSGFNGFGVSGTLLTARSSAPVFTQELRFVAPLGPQVEWLGGVFYTHEYTTTSNYTVLATDPISGQVAGQEWLNNTPTGYLEYAAFTDFTYHITNRFDIQLGGRESHTENSLAQSSTGPLNLETCPAPVPCTVPRADSSASTFTYLVTPRFRFNEDLMLYARFASGYRPGGPNAGAIGAPPQYNPDTTDNYELGLKGDLLNHTLSVDVSAYYIDWKHLQIFQFTDNGTGYTSNGGAAKSEGLELTLESKPVTGLTLSGWVAYDNAVLKDAFPTSNEADLNNGLYGLRGDRLPNTPRVSGNVSIEDVFPLWTNAKGYVGGSVSYVGDRLGVFLGPPSQMPVRQDFPAYTKADLHAGFRQDGWTTNFYVNNLGNKRGLVNGGLGYIQPSAYIYITPRTIGLSIARSF